ncbi:WD40 repeat domain-containing protein [Sphingosinicella sp. BN140058]|uniref:WD40 repeat domain-containing protein n=1 Tax=Sphingosinicella sp. BN140058 TaxID=1892855 RepID=UPI0010104BA8|nr:WD40 repeat domain-containing protein [Sphingosinicella sp. BN140058]QAY77583.1 WD40 repeat domain-containing protein [Sphingosinicella sp. BN140058]
MLPPPAPATRSLPARISDGSGGSATMLKIDARRHGDDVTVMTVTEDQREIWRFEVDDDWLGCGAGRDHVWVGDRDGTITLYDARQRRKSGAVFVPRGKEWQPASISRDGRRLYLFQPIETEESSTLHVIDLEAGRIVASHAGIPGHLDAYPAERPDGRLLLTGLKRPGTPGITVVTIDPADGERTEEVLGDGPPSDRVIASPDGRYLLRRDLTMMPRRSLGGAPRRLFGFGRRSGQAGEVHYGLVWQVWEASPLRFVRRIVAQWMRAEELLDAFYFGTRLPPAEAARCRRALWDTVADTLGAPNAPPEGGPPPPEAFRTDIFDEDEMLRLVGDSVENLRTSPLISKFRGWQPDGEAFWVATAHYLTCVGLDGSVSPRLSLERKGLESTVVLESACSFKDIRALDGRKAEVRYDDGTAILDGAPSSDIVRAVPLEADQWCAAPPPPPPAAPDPRGNRLSIPLAGWSGAAVEEAIDALAAEMDVSLAARAEEGEVCLTFQDGEESIAETAFFDRVAEQVPSAAPALRRLIERFVAVARDSEFLFSDAENGHGFLSHAVLALGLLDREALPVIQSYGRVVDREHEYDFAGLVVPRLIAAHGWSDAMIDFVFWVMIRNYFNTLQDFTIVWQDWGLRDALIAQDPEVVARRVATLHRRDLKSGRFAAGRRKGGLAQLASDIAKPHEPWLAAFLREAKRCLAA